MATSPLDYILQGARKILDKGQDAFRDDTNLGIAKNTVLGLPQATRDVLFPTRGFTETQLKQAQPTIKDISLSIPRLGAEFSSAIGGMLGQSGTSRAAQFAQTKVGGKLADVGGKITDFSIPKTPEQAKAMRIADIATLFPVGSLKVTTSGASVIAKTRNLGKIKTVLKTEIPKLTDDMVEAFGRVLVDVDNVDDVQRVLNRTNFQLQKAKPVADDMSLQVKSILETGKPVPTLPPVASKVGTGANLLQEAKKETIEQIASRMKAEGKTLDEFVKAQAKKDYVLEVRKTTVNDIAKVGTYGEAGSAKTSARRKLASDITNKEIEIAQRDQKLFDTNKNKTIEQLQNEITETKKWADENNTSYPRSIQVKEEIIKTKSQLTDIWNKAQGTKATTHDIDAVQALREAKGLSAKDIMAKHPDLNLKRDIPVTDIYGNKSVIPEGEALTPYELKGNKVLLQDGETYIVSKNQYQNIKGNALSGEAKPFAPELEGLEESIKSAETKKKIPEGYGEKPLEQYKAELKRQMPKYENYTLPNGENYREILIKAPETLKKGEYGTDVIDKSQTFRSSHWDEPNVISHLRLNDRTYKGKKVTFMEELQSDWAREGKAKGFATDKLPEGYSIRTVKRDVPGGQVNAYEIIDKNGELLGTGNTKEIAERVAINNLTKGIPFNPFVEKGKWVKPTIKRALKEAVDNGSDYFAWINGEQTSARYNLATQVDNVKWFKEYSGSGKNVVVKAVDGKEIIIGLNDSGIIENRAGTVNVPSDWSGKKLDEVLGKGLADKIMAQESGTLSGEGLKFGGEWANTLYDKQVGNIVKDLTGAEIEKLDMGLPIESQKTKWFKTNGVEVRPQDLIVGRELKETKQGNSYIITDILGDGKFKAVPKSDTFKFSERFGLSERELNSAYNIKEDLWAKRNAETFDISQKTTTQQGIRLTPEIKSIVKGEALPLKKPSGIDILKTFAKNYAKNPKLGMSAEDVTGGLRSDSFAKAKKVTEIDRLIASGDIRVKSVNGTDVYQYKKGGQWVNARNEDSAVAQVTKPKVSKAVQLPEELVYKKIDIDLREQELKENPLNNLVKYSAKRGDMKGRLPEVLGEGKSKFGRKGDQIVTEELSNLDITSEEARDAFEDFMARKEALQMEKDQVKREISAFREQAKLSQQKTSEIKPQAQIREEVEKAQQEYINRQNQTPTTPLKSSSYKDNTTAMIERKRAFETPTTPLGIYGKLQQSLSPVKFLDEVSQKIYKDWSRTVEKAKVLGDKELSTFKIPTKDSWQSILDYQAGKKTAFTGEIKNKFDSLFKEAGARGLDIGYNERYLPQVYKESADEIKDKIAQYLLKNGMSKEEILAYQNGKKLSGDIARRLKLNPFFSKEKVFPDYKTAMEYGLTPKYKDLNQLVAHYRKEMETTIANRNFIENLINNNKLLLVEDAPSSWKPVELPFSVKGYYAEPRLAKVLNGLFGVEKGFLDTMFSVGASASRRAQEISLSAGIPYTSVNFFSIGQLIKEMTSGNFKAVIPFVRANLGTKSLEYFNQNRNYLEMMADEGLRLGNHVGTLGNTYKNLAGKKKFWEGLGVQFDKAFNEKTFASFMPQLYTQTFKDIYLKGIKSGLGEKEARVLAGETVKKAFGLIDDLGRSGKTEDKLSAVFFAPKFREGVINTLKNTAKAGGEFVYNLGGVRKPLDPTFSKNRKLLAGIAITYAIYNAVNYALNGNFMWDNPENRKFALQIPRKGGELIYVEFMPSFLAFARNIISGGFNLVTGDVKGATQKLGSLFSMPVKTSTEVIANKDYFGNEIYKDEDSALVKAGKIAKYVGLAVNHPYIKEIINQIGDKKPLYQSTAMALELPVKFGSVQKVSKSKEFGGNLTLKDIQKSIKADVESGKIDTETAIESYIRQRQALIENRKKERLDMSLSEFKKSLASDIKEGLVTEDEGVEEYISYKQEEEQQAKREEQMKETYPDRNLVNLVIDYAKAYKTDPVMAWKAMVTSEKLDKVAGDKVTLQRFFGKHYLDPKEGSEAYMKKELNKLGIPWSDRENYNLEHIIPLTAGGDNSSNNLQIISRELHNTYTPVDTKAGKAVESGKLSRRQVARIMRQLKIDKTITVEQALKML